MLVTALSSTVPWSTVLKNHCQKILRVLRFTPPPLQNMVQVNENVSISHKLLVITNLCVRVLSLSLAVILDESAANLSRGAPHQLGVVAGVHQQLAVEGGQLGRRVVLNLETRKFSRCWCLKKILLNFLPAQIPDYECERRWYFQVLKWWDFQR